MDTIDMISGMSGSIALVLLAINSIFIVIRLERLERTAMVIHDKAEMTRHNTERLVGKIIYEPFIKAAYSKQPMPSQALKAEVRKESNE